MKVDREQVIGVRRASAVWEEQEARCRADGVTVTVVHVLGSRQLREAVEWWAMMGWAPEEPVPTGGAVFGIDMGMIAWTFRRIEGAEGESEA